MIKCLSVSLRLFICLFLSFFLCFLLVCCFLSFFLFAVAEAMIKCMSVNVSAIEFMMKPHQNTDEEDDEEEEDSATGYGGDGPVRQHGLIVFRHCHSCT